MLPTPFNAQLSSNPPQIVPAKRKRTNNGAHSPALTNNYAHHNLINGNSIINNNNNNSNNNNNNYRVQQQPYEPHTRPGLSPPLNSLPFTPQLPPSPFTYVDVGGVTPASVSEDIKCICGFNDDDGFTIACDVCGRWSHMSCFGLNNSRVPDEWSCVECEPRPVDAQAARELQLRRRSALQSSLSSRDEPMPLNGPVTTKKRKERRVSAVPMSQSASGSGHGHGHGQGQGLGHADIHASAHDNEHIDIEDEWRSSYVHITEDEIPGDATRAKLRLVAQDWRGVTALADDFDADSRSRSGSSGHMTKVVPVPGPKNDVLPTSFALQTTAPIPGESLIAPFTSTVIPSASYLSDPLNGYAQLGMPKPYVHLVPPPLSVALDARMTGNETRFVRSGCRPNAVLRPVLCSSQQARNSHLNGEHAVAQENDDTGVLKFAIYALRDLKACEEVVLGWEWDDGAVVHQLPALIEEGSRAGPSKMTPHHIKRLRLQMQTIVESLKSNFVTCACGNAARDCAIRLMEEFSNDERSLLGVPRNNTYPNGNGIDATRSYYDSRSSSGTPLPHECSPVNRHPTSLSSLRELTRNSRAKEKARVANRSQRDLGPLVGTRRGITTRVTGGAHEGGLRGVTVAQGDVWDRYGQLETVENRTDQVLPSKLNRKGKGKVSGTISSTITAGSYSHQPESILFSGMRQDGDVTIQENKMPPKMRKRWMHEKMALISDDRGHDQSKNSSGDSTTFTSNVQENNIRDENGHTSSINISSLSLSIGEMSDRSESQFMPPPPPPSAPAESRLSPNISSPVSIISNHSFTTEAPRRPSTLFSLLNEHPVSPISTSKRLETPPVKGPVSIEIDEAASVIVNNHPRSMTPLSSSQSTRSLSSEPQQQSQVTDRSPSPNVEPGPDSTASLDEESQLVLEDEEEFLDARESRELSHDTIQAVQATLPSNPSTPRERSPSQIQDTISSQPDVSMQDISEEVVATSQTPLESPVMLFKEELMEVEAKRRAASTRQEEEITDVSTEEIIVPSPVLTGSLENIRDDPKSPTRSPTNVSADLEALDVNAEIKSDGGKVTSSVEDLVDVYRVNTMEDEMTEVLPKDLDVNMESESEPKLELGAKDEDVNAFESNNNIQDTSRVQTIVDIRVQIPSPAIEQHLSSKVSQLLNSPEPESVSASENGDIHLSQIVLEKLSPTADYSPKNYELSGDNLPHVKDDEKVYSPLNIQRDISPALSTASTVEQPTPIHSGSSTEANVLNPQPSIISSNTDSNQKGRDSPDILATATTAHPERQIVRRTMAAYKERKKRQREEEAAKAAIASPVTPAAQFPPSNEALDTMTSKIDRPEDESNFVVVEPLVSLDTQGIVPAKEGQNVSPIQDSLVRDEAGGLIEPVSSTVVLNSQQQDRSPSPDSMEERVDFSPTPEPELKNMVPTHANQDDLNMDDSKQVPIRSPTLRPTKEEGEIISSSPVLPKTKPIGIEPIQQAQTQRERAQSIPISKPLSTPSSSSHSPNIDQSRYRANSRGHTPPRQPRALRDPMPPPQSHRFQSPNAPGPSPHTVPEEKKLVGRIQWDRPPPTQVPPPKLSMRISSAPVKDPPPNKPLSAGTNPAPLLSRMPPLPPKHDHTAGQSGNDMNPRSGMNSSGRSNPPVAPRNMMMAQRGQQPPRGPHALTQRDLPRERGRDYSRDRDREHYSPPRGRQSGRGRSWSRAGR